MMVSLPVMFEVICLVLRRGQCGVCLPRGLKKVVL